MRLDAVAGVVVDRTGGQVELSHAEALLDLEEPVVGPDDEFECGIWDVREEDEDRWAQWPAEETTGSAGPHPPETAPQRKASHD